MAGSGVREQLVVPSFDCVLECLLFGLEFLPSFDELVDVGHLAPRPDDLVPALVFPVPDGEVRLEAIAGVGIEAVPEAAVGSRLEGIVEPLDEPPEGGIDHSPVPGGVPGEREGEGVPDLVGHRLGQCPLEVLEAAVAVFPDVLEFILDVVILLEVALEGGAVGCYGVPVGGVLLDQFGCVLDPVHAR